MTNPQEISAVTCGTGCDSVGTIGFHVVDHWNGPYFTVVVRDDQILGRMRPKLCDVWWIGDLNVNFLFQFSSILWCVPKTKSVNFRGLFLFVGIERRDFAANKLFQVKEHT